MYRIGFLVAFMLITFGVSKSIASDVVTLTDIAGRTINLKRPISKVLLGEGRFLPTLAILEKDDPVGSVSTMMADFHRYDPATYAQYKAKFPKITEIPEVGASGSASFSAEQAIATHPDAAIFGLGSGHGPGARNKEIIAQLEAAGIPVVIVDFRIDPLVNTPKSMRLLGQILGREKEAEEFLQFYNENLALIADRLKSVSRKPRVFMELRVGLRDQCCETTGQQMMGRFIDLAGGTNIVAKKIPGTHGVVNAEFLISEQPDIYIATAIGNYPSSNTPNGQVILGAGTPPKVAADSLAHALRRPIVSELNAIKSAHAYAIWHHFYNTPMHVAAVQAMAKWFHPTVFADIDPTETLTTYFDRFQPMPLAGVYWTGMTEK